MMLTTIGEPKPFFRHKSCATPRNCGVSLFSTTTQPLQLSLSLSLFPVVATTIYRLFLFLFFLLTRLIVFNLCPLRISYSLIGFFKCLDK